MSPPSIHYVEEPSGVEKLARALSKARRFGMDTESNSLHVYREQVCFIQVCVEDQVFLLDTLALTDISSLAPFFADPKRTKILHGADYDVACLKRDFGFQLEGLFDTMIAAQLLGYERLGLAALVEKHCGVLLDKSLTRHDWGARPLEEKYHRYLVEDVVHLEKLYRILEAELHEQEIEEEAGLEFRHVAQKSWNRPEMDPEGFRRIKGAGRLDQPALSVLRELYLLREKLASKTNRPPFKILGNTLLLEVARRRPRSREALRRLPSFSQFVVRRHGTAVLGAVQRGIQNCKNVSLRDPHRKAPRPAREAAIIDGLKEWRKKRVASEQRMGTLILPNYLIETLAQRQPATLDELADMEELGKSRFERYGEEILGIVRHPPPQDGWRHRQKRRS